MNNLFLNQIYSSKARSIKIIPDKGPIPNMIREFLSPNFQVCDCAPELTVVCDDADSIPEKGGVIVLSTRDENCGRIIFMQRPVDLEKLLNNAVLLTEPCDFASGGYSINKINRTVALGSNEVVLTEKEFAMFSILYESVGLLVTKEELCRKIWSDKSIGACDVCACYLRRKLEALCGKGALVSVRGKGYILLSQKESN